MGWILVFESHYLAKSKEAIFHTSNGKMQCYQAKGKAGAW